MRLAWTFLVCVGVVFAVSLKAAMVVNPFLFPAQEAGGLPEITSGSYYLWLDATDTTTLFDATNGGNYVTTHNAEVLRWEDKSGNNRHFVKKALTGSPSGPLLSTNYQADLHALNLNGRVLCANTWWALNGTNSFYVFAVAHLTPSSGYYRYLLASGGASAAANSFALMSSFSGTNMSFYTAVAGTGWKANSGNAMPNTMEKVSGYYSYDNGQNGLKVGTGSTATQASGSPIQSPWYSARIGSSWASQSDTASTSGTWAGYVRTIIIVRVNGGGYLSTNDFNSINDYLDTQK